MEVMNLKDNQQLKWDLKEMLSSFIFQFPLQDNYFVIYEKVSY